APQIALDHVVAIDDLADLEHLGIGELRHPPLGREVTLLHDLTGRLRPDSMNVLQRDHDALVGRNIDASDTGHALHSCCRSAEKAPGCVSNLSEGPQRVKTTPSPAFGARHRLNVLRLNT